MSEPTTNTNTTGQVQNEPTTNNSNAEWKSSLDKIFEKLDSIIDNKSNSVARSALRDNGFEDEEIKSKKRYIICKYYLIKMLVDFADSKAEAEAKLKKLQEKE